MCKKRFFRFAVLVTFLLSGAQSSYAQKAMEFAVDPNPLIIVSRGHTLAFPVEIAKTVQQRSAGLMYRMDFPYDRAMLFGFDKPQSVKMWMANTPLSLDMLFIDDRGKIVDIVTGTTPYSHKIISSRFLVSYVVEMNTGIVEGRQLSLGDRVIHPMLCGWCGGRFAMAGSSLK